MTTTPGSAASDAPAPVTRHQSPRPSTYRSGISRAVLAATAASLVAVSEVVEAVFIVPGHDQLVVSQYEGDWTPDYGLAYSFVAFGTFVLLGVAYVTTCVWLWQARRNSEILAPHYRHSHGQGWVWGGWVTPILFLWFPVQVVGDIATVSRQGARPSPDHENGEVGPERRVEGSHSRLSALLGFWWGFWIAYLITGQIASRLIPWSGEPSPRSADALVWVEIINAALALAALGFWIAVIKGIHRSQQLSAAALYPPPTETSPSPVREGAGVAWVILTIPALILSGFILIGTAAVSALYELVNEPVAAEGGPASGETPASNKNDGDREPDPEREPDETVSEDVTSVPFVEVGDCLPKVPTGLRATVKVVPCSQPHRAEVYAVWEMGGGPYPRTKQLVRLADDGCWKRFKPYIGHGYYSSNLEFTYSMPDEEAWRNDARTVVCVVYDKAPFTGTLRGSRR